MPAKRSGRPEAAAISVIERAEVLLANRACFGAWRAAAWKASTFSAIVSGTDSMTRSAFSSASERLEWRCSERFARSATSAASFLSSTPLSRLRWMLASAFFRASALVS